MANNLTNYAESKLLDHILGKTSYTKPTTYVALFTAAPGEAGGGTEVSGGSYARVALSSTAASSGVADNDVAITFPVASAGWGTITHVAIMDASSGGNMLMYAALDASKVVASGDQFSFAAGALDFTLE